MAYSVTQSFISGQPPLLVFTMCLMAFGLTMVILAYLIGEQEVPNPDVQMDWNKIFTKVANHHMCVPPFYLRKINEMSPLFHHNTHDISTSANLTFNSSLSHIIDESKSMSAVLSNVVDRETDNIDDTTIVNTSVKAVFGLTNRFKFLNSFSCFKGNVKGKQLGFGGKFSTQTVNISLNFQRVLNVSCDLGCQEMQEVCLTFDLPLSLLPKTRSPEKCQMSSQNVVPTYFIDLNSEEETCMTLDYTPDAKLTEMLSLHDRSVVNLHLMHTSYFMFVMVMTLLCYSLIKGRYRHQKNSSEKILLEA